MNAYMELLGYKAKDRVTGFSGVVTSIAFDLFGCVQVILCPEANDGKLGESHWFDIKRLSITSNEPVMDVPDFGGAIGDETGPERKPSISTRA